MYIIMSHSYNEQFFSFLTCKSTLYTSVNTVSTSNQVVNKDPTKELNT